jgi:hypothetical protein
MRTADDHPVGPEIEAALAAIDATLAGDAVDPSHAELAELALILAAERPQPTAAFTAALDRRVAARFAGEGRRRRVHRWLLAPAAGLAAAMSVAVIVVLGTSGSGPASSSASSAAASSAAASATHAAGSAAASAPGSPKRVPPTSYGPNTTAPSGVSASSSSSASGSAGSSGAAGSAGSSKAAQSPGSSGAAGSAGSSKAAQSPGSSGAAGSASSSPALAPIAPVATVQAPPPAPAPPANGRKIIQSAQLALNAPPNRIDDVAQQVFDVVGNEQGIVNRSTVTATGNSDGYAEFDLSVPSASLADTMTALSRLRYASVVSRTDATQDVNGQFNAATSRLADARALRTSLLKQLAAAVTQTQIDSLTAQIHDAEASISSDQAALGRLNHQINYSQITVTINAATVVPVPTGSSFTIGKAAHDAGRVLTVVAGVALIALAGLVPLALLGALAGWLGLSVRRRRRQQALDLA